ncbi:secreted RxLR effector protein 161-like [Rhagoletis pomonella]|uniref:secreted RxLR effector protein 161-like n=1 Tax=Rhagoletis pomonella TaxID=28610 RepID=UPI0017841434|nr:secreted RxLR effector protein 161-like [Rhagoletis pomonella]
MENCKPISTPSDPNVKLSKDFGSNKNSTESELKRIPYQEAVGCLLYLSQATRPDIAFAVNDVSRFNSTYNLAHWTAVKRIFRYLKGTADLKLRYSKESGSDIYGFCDADYASDVDKRRSCTGYIFKLSNAAVTWHSKRQPTVALSTTEAEYLSMSAAVREALWLKQFVNELDRSSTNTIPINCDNMSSIELAEVEGFRNRTKHIDVRHHHIRDMINEGVVSIKYIPSEEMAADNLTKAVPRDKHQFCVKQCGLC